MRMPSVWSEPRVGPTVTLDKFRRLRMGMSLVEVEQIIGGKCTVMLEVGQSVLLLDLNFTVYMCDGNGGLGSNMTFTMQSGRLISKVQFGLH